MAVVDLGGRRHTAPGPFTSGGASVSTCDERHHPAPPSLLDRFGHRDSHLVRHRDRPGDRDYMGGLMHRDDVRLGHRRRRLGHRARDGLRRGRRRYRDEPIRCPRLRLRLSANDCFDTPAGDHTLPDRPGHGDPVRHRLTRRPNNLSNDQRTTIASHRDDPRLRGGGRRHQHRPDARDHPSRSWQRGRCQCGGIPFSRQPIAARRRADGRDHGHRKRFRRLIRRERVRSDDSPYHENSRG